MSRPTAEQQSRPAYEPYSPRNDANPHAMYEILREKAPLTFWEQGRCWVLSRYEDIVSIMRDEERFTTSINAWEFASNAGAAALVPEMTELRQSEILTISRKDHVRLRKLISPAFTLRATELLRPEIQVIVDKTLDKAQAAAVARGGVINVVKEVSEDIPLRVMTSMLKVPPGHDQEFHDFTVSWIKTLQPGMLNLEEVPTARKHIREGIAIIRETIEERRRNLLENDLLSTLIQAEEEGSKLSTTELISLVASLIAGGVETSIHLISFSIYHLLQRPELAAQARNSPELLKKVADEVLRYDYIIKLGLTRFALEDVELYGQTIKKGQMVLLAAISGLRDETAFSQANVFDVNRGTYAHLGYGHGAHYCVGAGLARLEVQVAAGSLLQRYPSIRLMKPPMYGPHAFNRKMEVLEVQLRPD